MSNKNQSLTTSQAVAAIDLYLTGRYSQMALADLIGSSNATVWKLLSFRRPYGLVPEILAPGVVERLFDLKRRRQRIGAFYLWRISIKLPK